MLNKRDDKKLVYLLTIIVRRHKHAFLQPNLGHKKALDLFS